MSTATSSAALRRGAGDEYVTFCNALRRVCGIDLLQYKRGQMERRIRSFAATRGAADLASYATTLRTDKDELEKFLDRVTINVSQLWRNPEQWETLEQQILPDLAATARHGNRLRAWSGRLLLRRRGLHLGRDRPPRHPARRDLDPGHRHRRPHGPARPHRRLHRSRTPATRRPRRWPATSS